MYNIPEESPCASMKAWAQVPCLSPILLAVRLHGHLKGQLEETTAQSEHNSGAHFVGLGFVMSHFVLQDFFFCTLQENNTIMTS